MECPECGREGCQIGWHQFTSKAKGDGKTEKGQGQKQAEVVGQTAVGRREAVPVVSGNSKRGPGRPRIYADPKVGRKEYMRRYRARSAKP